MGDPQLPDGGLVSAPTMPRPTDAMTVESRVETWLARLRLEEKLGQMIMGERASTTPEDVRECHLGAVLSGSGSVPGANTPADWVALNDAYWRPRWTIRADRSPIPLLYAWMPCTGTRTCAARPSSPTRSGLAPHGILT